MHFAIIKHVASQYTSAYGNLNQVKFVVFQHVTTYQALNLIKETDFWHFSAKGDHNSVQNIPCQYVSTQGDNNITKNVAFKYMSTLPKINVKTLVTLRLLQAWGASVLGRTCTYQMVLDLHISSYVRLAYLCQDGFSTSRPKILILVFVGLTHVRLCWNCISCPRWSQYILALDMIVSQIPSLFPYERSDTS